MRVLEREREREREREWRERKREREKKGEKEGERGNILAAISLMSCILWVPTTAPAQRRGRG